MSARFSNLQWVKHPKYPYDMATARFANGIELSFLGRGSSIYTEAPDMYECLVVVPEDYSVLDTSILYMLDMCAFHGTSDEMQRIMELIEMQPAGGHKQRSIR